MQTSFGYKGGLFWIYCACNHTLILWKKSCSRECETSDRRRALDVPGKSEVRHRSCLKPKLTGPGGCHCPLNLSLFLSSLLRTCFLSPQQIIKDSSLDVLLSDSWVFADGHHRMVSTQCLVDLYSTVTQFVYPCDLITVPHQ